MTDNSANYPKKPKKKILLHIINKPFRLIINSILKSLRNTDLTGEEKRIIDSSIEDKYVPVLRNAFLFAIISTPAYAENPQAAYVIFGIITSLTGLAWFSMSLKDVKTKFGGFGIELTADMLEAFLTSLFLVALIAALNSVVEPAQQIFQLIHNSSLNRVTEKITEGITLMQHSIPTSILLIIGIIIPLGVIFRIIKKLVHATIKYDANDAMLTGSSDAAQIFFKKATSSLLKASDILKTDHSLEVANYQIIIGLENYLYSLASKEIIFPEGVSHKDIEEMRNNPFINQKNFDTMVIPIFERCITQYIPLVQENKIDKLRCLSVISDLKTLLKLYESNHPTQAYSDTVIAHTLEALADLFDSYHDQLR